MWRYGLNDFAVSDVGDQRRMKCRRRLHLSERMSFLQFD